MVGDVKRQLDQERAGWLQLRINGAAAGPTEPEAIARLPWGQNLTLLEPLDDPATRMLYAEQVIAHGWSRAILAMNIQRQLHKRAGRAVNNFKATLPPPDSDLAAQVFKDPYLFDFLGTADPRRERELRSPLVTHIERFLLELGAGFAAPQCADARTRAAASAS